MRNSKLIEGLQSLSKKDLVKLEDFLRSPYFNKSEEILQFYQYLKSNISKSGEKYLDKAYVYNKLYGKAAYNGKKLINLMNHLNDRLEEFLIQRAIEDDQSKRLTYLLENFISTGLDKHYKHALKQYQGYLDSFTGDSSQFYLETYTYNNLIFEHSAKSNIRASGDHLQNVVDNLDVYYMVEKLRLSTEIINRKRIIEGSFETRLLDELLEQVAFPPFDEIPAIQIYGQLIRLLRNENDIAAFDRVKSLLKKHAGEFSKDEARQMYAYAINHSLRSYNKGEKAFLNDAFELHKALLEQDLLLIDQVIPPWRFKNMVTIGLMSGDLDWTSQFIDEFEQYLSKDHKSNLLAFCRANLLFECKKYDESIALLHGVEPGDDVFLAIDSKSLLSKIYYEKEEWEALQNLLESFRMYVRRNKILSQYHKTTRLNFIKYLKKLQKAHVASSEELQELKREVEEVKMINSSEWLVKMIDQKIRS